MYSQSDSLQLPYQGFLLRLKSDRNAWWGEVLFDSKFVSCTGPHNSQEEALRTAKLKSWKRKLETLESPAAIVSMDNLAIVFQNIPSILLFNDLLHQKVSDFLNPSQIEVIAADLDSNHHFRTRIRMFDWSDSPFEGEFSGEIIEIPDKFIICKLLSSD